MKFLIAGLGSIGRRHLKNLLALGESDILLYRTHRSSLADEELADFPEETDIYKALAHQPDAVIISNPTALHMQVAIPSAEAGCALFIEKPIANKLDDLQPFERILRENNNIVCTAYHFRFNPGLQKICEWVGSQAAGKPLTFDCHWGDYLPDWHPWEDYSSSYAARKEMGGGVVLTLSHPLDYLRWIFGEAAGLYAYTARVSGLDLDVEDAAHALINYRRGVSGVLHLDYFQRPKRHDLRIVCSQGVLGWDYHTSCAYLVHPNGSSEEQLPPVGFERNDMYLQEMRHFIDALRHKAQPQCDYEDGKKALELALAIIQSGRYQRRVVFDD